MAYKDKGGAYTVDRSGHMIDPAIDDYQIRRAKLLDACRLILEAIGEDLGREGLLDTPERFADAWVEFAGYEDGNADTTFEAIEADQMVIVKDIRVWSMCEHHLLPFRCDITIGCLCKDRLLGLSKFARVAKLHAHRLQTQERLAFDIAEHLRVVLGTEDVAVMCVGEHTCMAMRGVEQQSDMITSAVYGRFRSEPAVRAEFFSLAKR